ncbi:hypothetical protein E2P30_02545 [Candidatus Bathyarchaeota archaeon]|nr:hypothetical protein E2P30_02545 [Candidatus Bathyarchaeota archaeon]
MSRKSVKCLECIIKELLRGSMMKGHFDPKDRNKLRLKMATVLGDNIQMLSEELQEILLDDLVTAFENRVKVLSKVQSDVQIEVAGSVDYETIQT